MSTTSPAGALEPTEAEVAELKSKHGRVHLLTLEDASLVVRIPTAFEFRKWQADSADEKKRIDGSADLLTRCTVWPAPEKAKEMLDARPGLRLSFFGELIELAGVSRSVEKKEL